MKTKAYIVFLIFVFAITVSSGAARACCWDMEHSPEHTAHVTTEVDMESCHTKNDKNTTDTENHTQQESNNCCYDTVECQAPVIKITKTFSIIPNSFSLIQSSSVNNFISNTIEPLKLPPKVLL